MNVFNHRRTRTGFTNARPNLERRKRKRRVSVLVYGSNNHGLHRLASLTLACLTILRCAFASTWYVDAAKGNDENAGTSWDVSLATIQCGVDKATSGDEILVNDGTYSPFRLTRGSYQPTYLAITVRSVNGPYKTIIECGQGGGVLLGNSGDYPVYGNGFSGPNGTIEGFTVRGGGRLPPTYYTYPLAGGYVKGCIITGSRGYTPVMSCIVYNSIFYGNIITGETGNYLAEFAFSKLYNCTVYENHGCNLSMSSIFYNCILYGSNNKPTDAYGNPSSMYKCYTDDPKFVDTEANDFRLLPISPCIDNGNNSYASSDDKDIARKPRINGGTVDIGAYEYYHVELSLKDITAKQRYPWNGKVDVEFKLETSDSNNCVVMLFAKDVAGGTNLPMRTVYKQDGTAVNMAGESLVPGTYNWVWDAAADLPDGFECERVAVEVTANNNPLYMVIDLSGGANASSYPVSYLNAVPDGGWTDEYKTTKLVLRRIEPGTFTMDGYGSSNTHKVTLTKAYYIGIFEVTQAQYLRVMGVNPSYHASSGEASPVEDVYWTDLRGAAAGIQFPSDTSCDSSSFFGIMRSRTSLSSLDLPTEAQWQYACMGNGTLGGVAESGTTRIVGTKSANGLGLYDMQGNVDEWMIDLWKQYGTGDCIDPAGGTSGTVRIIKGGYYGQTGSDPCNKVGFRCNENQACRHQYTGFRVCMTLR